VVVVVMSVAMEVGRVLDDDDVVRVRRARQPR